MSKIIAFTGMLAALVLALWLARPVPEPLAQAQAETERARAEQERARAAQLRAEAAITAAHARTAAAEAEAAEKAVPQMSVGRMLAYIGGGSAVAVLLIGGALAAVAWANTKARVVYPDANGFYPILIERQAGGAVVVDVSRALGPVIRVVGDGKVQMPLPASEQSALQIATQAQAAATMLGVSRAGKPVVDVAERIGKAAANLPAPTFSTDEPRFVYVNNDGSSKSARFMADLREFIVAAWQTGLTRSLWLGRRFESGNRCSRTYYDMLCKHLAKANCIHKEGGEWTVSVELEQALDAFQFSTAVE